MSELEQEYLYKLEKRINDIGVSNDFLVSIMKLCETYLNLQRISVYSKENRKTPQGMRKYRKNNIIKICDYQLIIDN